MILLGFILHNFVLPGQMEKDSEGLALHPDCVFAGQIAQQLNYQDFLSRISVFLPYR